MKIKNASLKEKIKKLEKNTKDKFLKEKRFIFHRLRYLEKHHQAWFSIIISLGLIFVWRGLWNLMDHYWFPSHSLLSNLSGIIVGIIVLLLAHKLLSLLTGD